MPIDINYIETMKSDDFQPLNFFVALFLLLVDIFRVIKSMTKIEIINCSNGKLDTKSLKIIKFITMV